MVAPANYTDEYFENVDHWYERYDREEWGKYTLYKLRLK
jgi:hypothetical protein